MKHLLFLLFFATATAAGAQTFSYLDEIKLKKDADYTKNEANVIKAIDYLMSSPVDAKNNDRKTCSRFIVVYATGTPYASISLDPYLLKVNEGNSDILPMYMGLFLKSSINSKNATTAEHEKYIFTEIYKYAKQGNNIVRNDVINSLVKAGDDDKIAEWVAKMRADNK